MLSGKLEPGPAARLKRWPLPKASPFASPLPFWFHADRSRAMLEYPGSAVLWGSEKDEGGTRSEPLANAEEPSIEIAGFLPTSVGNTGSYLPGPTTSSVPAGTIGLERPPDSRRIAAYRIGERYTWWNG